jgi:hypothetical protein
MVAIIVISFLALAAAAFTIYLSERVRITPGVDDDLPPVPSRGLFADDGASEAALIEAEQRTKASNRRGKLLERARSGDLQALAEAHADGDATLYGNVLDALSEWGFERQENFIALVSHISKSNELRANQQMAQRVIEAWKTEPDGRSTTEMLHIAALSDDAATYEQAIESVFSFWQRGRLSEFSPEELVELLESHYWILSLEARRGGAGFALKRKLAGVRRELAAAAPER